MRGGVLVEPVLCCCTVVTSQPVTVDMTVTFLSSHRRLELKSDPRENNSHPCAQRTLHPFCVVFPLLQECEGKFLAAQIDLRIQGQPEGLSDDQSVGEGYQKAQSKALLIKHMM